MCRIFVVSNEKEEKWLFLKDALWGGGGTHRSWPGGRGGRPRALIPGKGSGKGWLGRQRLNTHPRGWLGGRGVREAGQGLGGGARASVPGGGGGRGTGPRDGANFATCVVFLLFLTRTKRRKMAFFEGCPAGWGGYPPELAWWTGG